MLLFILPIKKGELQRHLNTPLGSIDTKFKKAKHDMTKVFHAWSYGSFIKIRATSGERNFIERTMAPIFLEAVLAIAII